MDPKHGSHCRHRYDDPVLKDADVRSGPFDAGATSGARATGYTCGNVGWYRKRFAAAAERNHTVVFEGVYQNSDVFVNGHHLGFHPYGCRDP